MKVTDLFEAKRVPSDKGSNTPGYDESSKNVLGTVKDWLARMGATAADIKAAVAQAEKLNSYAPLSRADNTTAAQRKNGTFSFSKPGDDESNDAPDEAKYLVYANGQIRSASKSGMGSNYGPPAERATRLMAPKPRLVAGDPVKSLVKIYDGAFKELNKKVDKLIAKNKKINEGKTGDFKDSKAMLAVVNSVMPKVKGLDMAPSGDTVGVSNAQLKKLLAAFKAAGYEPYEQLDAYWVIESKAGEEHGIVIDMRDDEDTGMNFFVDDL